MKPPFPFREGRLFPWGLGPKGSLVKGVTANLEIVKEMPVFLAMEHHM